MKNVIVIGCGSYMDSGYGCPGEWRCLKAAAMGEGHFDEPVAVTGLLKCVCPGRNTIANLKMTMKLSEVTPDAVYLSSCLAKAKPDCPYFDSPEQLADMIKANFDLPVVLGTHQY
jgi:predicted metal-binding protein